MIAPRMIPLVLKQVWRHRTRSVLTAAGVAAAMFLFVAVQALQAGVRAATQVTAADTMLVVYRENRFCPATSRLPERYAPRIARVPGVAGVAPMKIVVNNCGASLDVVTFRGVRKGEMPSLARGWAIIDGSIEAWEARSDAALVGERLAGRRGLRAGDSFDAAGVTVTVAGILRSADPQDQGAAYVDLEFLQRAAGKGGGPGVVTQFLVRVDDPARLEDVARAIDAEFRADEEPTQTRPEKAFVAQAGSDIVEIVGFTRWLAWGCLGAVLALVANAIVLSVQDRVKEHAILQTLGYRPGLIARLIVGEGLVIGLLGGLAGATLAALSLKIGRFTMTSEGVGMVVDAGWGTIALGAATAAGVGVLAGLVPAWRAGRQEIARCFRAV